MADVIDERLASYPSNAAAVISALREKIHKLAEANTDCGEIVEALKWGQVSFLTQKPKSGTTIRFDENKTGGVSMYVNCNSMLIEQYRAIYPNEFKYVGNREVILPTKLAERNDELDHLLLLALTYHKNKKQSA